MVSGQGYIVTAVDGVGPGGLADFGGHTALTVERNDRTFRLVGDGAEHSGGVRFYQKYPGVDDKDIRLWRITDRSDGMFVAVPAAAF